MSGVTRIREATGEIEPGDDWRTEPGIFVSIASVQLPGDEVLIQIDAKVGLYDDAAHACRAMAAVTAERGPGVKVLQIEAVRVCDDLIERRADVIQFSRRMAVILEAGLPDIERPEGITFNALIDRIGARLDPVMVGRDIGWLTHKGLWWMRDAEGLDADKCRIGLTEEGKKTA